LLNLKQDLKRLTKTCGHLILTGILNERDSGFVEKFNFSGYEIIERSTKDEWVGYLCKKL